MPFVNPAQRAACYAQRARDLKAGRKPRWDCEAFEHGHKKRKKKKGGQGRGSRVKREIVPLTQIRRKIKHREHGSGTVQTGPRGGKFVVYRKGNRKYKVYI
jgi:hypothetical protein